MEWRLDFLVSWPDEPLETPVLLLASRVQVALLSGCHRLVQSSGGCGGCFEISVWLRMLSLLLFFGLGGEIMRQSGGGEIMRQSE
jgi:hypothetical protein